MQDVVQRVDDGSLKPHISQMIPFNQAVGVLNSLDRYSCGKTVVKMDTEFTHQLTSWMVSFNSFSVWLLYIAQDDVIVVIIDVSAKVLATM